MNKNQLGTSELFISELGFGCMSLGTEPNKAESLLKAAVEEGINYFDTADLYDFGENEKLVGTTLRPIREQVIIATKVGNRWTKQQDSWSWDPSKSYIKEAVKDSLKRLNTDYLDLYQLHGGTMEDHIEETIEAFEELIQEGLIRYYGISSIRPNVIREYVSKSNIQSVMMQYSILDRRPEEESLALLNQHNISVVTRGSLAKGLLSNTTTLKASPSVKEKGYLDYSFSELENALKKLKSDFDRPLNEIALQYNLSQQAVASVIVGASSIQQLKENVHAVNSKRLTTEEIEHIRSFTKANQYIAHR